MDYAELDKYLRQYFVKEKWYLRERNKEVQCLELSDSEFEAENQEPRLLESHHFMKAEQKIVISRQERFERIYTHKHDFIELCYVWSGECHQNVEGEQIRIIQGDVCILDTQARHSFAAGREEDILINILMRKEFFDSAFLSRMSRQGIVSEFLVNAVMENRARKHYLYFSTHKSKRIHEIMSQLLMEYFTGDMGMETVLESYLIILFTELFRILRNDSPDKEKLETDIRILELLEYMDKNYETCTLNEMAQKFGLSGNYLTTLLKEKTGHSYLEHIQEKKLQKARILLENTDFSIAEIIERCGYHNMNFFYRKFKEAEGCTPSQFRERYRIS